MVKLMDINESIQRINQITNKITATLNHPIYIHNQIQQSIMPILEIQNKVAQSVQPLIEFQDRLSSMLENTYNISSYTDNITSSVNSYMSNLVSLQLNISDRLSNLHVDISNSYISSDSSMQFSQIITDILDEINDGEINDMEATELTECTQELLTPTSSKVTLTWWQILDIIVAILTLISIIQAQLPNPQLTNIENDFYQLIEIEKQQLNLLEELRNE